MIKLKVTLFWMILCNVLLLQGCASRALSNSELTNQHPVKNVLFILVDDLRPELKAFGAHHIHSPNIDNLASQSRIFMNHFVNSPSCGPSRYSLLTGRYGPTSNNALMTRGKALAKGQSGIPSSLPEWFKSHGYTTVSVGKVSHYPGGKGGQNWNDEAILEMPNSWTKTVMPVGAWGTPKGMMHGLAHGETRVKASEMDVYQAKEGDDNIYPDGLITDAAISQIQQLAAKPDSSFFLAVGIIRPHLPFGAPKKYLDLYQNVEFPDNPFPDKPEGKSTWHNSGEFKKYNRWGKNPLKDKKFADSIRRHYAASVSYADAQVGKILRALEATGAHKNTLIVLWGDHGWNLGEHAIWGKHNLFEEALRSPLLVSYPNMPKPGTSTAAVVETVDIFPTLTKLMGLPTPEFTHGKSILKYVEKANLPGHLAYAYNKSNHTIRKGNFRLTLFGNQDYALYKLDSVEKETKNVASQYSDITNELLEMLEDKMTLNDKF